MRTLEKDIERKLCVMVQQHGGMCLKWVCPGWAGVPDRIILLPGGSVMFVELKRQKDGRVSSLQRWWRSKLIDLGFDAWFVFSEQDIQTLELVILDKIGRRKGNASN